MDANLPSLEPHRLITMSDSTMESTDRILGELESIARRADPENNFYRRLTESLVPILQADCVLLAIELESKPLVLFHAGKEPDEHRVQQAIDQAFSDTKQSRGTFQGANRPEHWIFERFPKSNQAMPLAILAHYQDPLHAHQTAGAINLLDAFAEVCEMREVYVENSRSVGVWKQALTRSQDFSNTTSHMQLHRSMVESLREALQADRVSFYVQDPKGASMIACSGAATIDPNASAVKDLQESVVELLVENKPKLWSISDQAPALAGYRLFLPWPSGPGTSQNGVLIEWSDPQAIIDRVQRASSLIPVLNEAWQNQNRWLHLPLGLREQTLRKTESISPRRSVPKKILGLIALASLVAMSLVPYPFYIHADAYLEPVDQRFVHATADSFIQELMIKEGQKVSLNQPLVQLRSPSLELQVEEADGQLRALEEKKNGLRIAVNQLSSNPSEVANQTRLSAELKLVEIQEQQALEKGRFLKKQQAELQLASPIQGVIVGGDLERELSNRPLQRGDVLFRIADLQGPWQLRLLVSDRDGGYVQRALADGPLEIDWGLENSPRIGAKASLVSLSREVDQRPLKGPCRTAIATLESDGIAQPVIGSVAYARIPCGKQPLWFIWSRPMIEFLQKRFWLTTTSNPGSIAEQGSSVQ